jgi:hypothetical protein
MNQCRKSTSQKKLPGRAVFGALTLCGACCALPLLGGALGAGSLVAAAWWLEWAAMGMLALSAVALIWMIVRRWEARYCETGCDCSSKPDQSAG